MVTIFNFVWACIMVGMWLDMRRGSKMYRIGRRPGLLTSVIEYAAAIREELGEKAASMSEEGLRKELTRSGGALVVGMHEMRVGRTATGVEVDEVKRGWRRRMMSGSTF
jgi:hypothetical protein